MIRFRHRPIEIEAIRFDGSAEGARTIVAWARLKDDAIVPLPGGRGEFYIAIPTMHGYISILSGMWVTRDPQGHYNRELDARMYVLWEQIPDDAVEAGQHIVGVLMAEGVLPQTGDAMALAEAAEMQKRGRVVRLLDTKEIR